MKAIVITNQAKVYNNGFKIMIEPLMELGFDVTWAANFDNFKGDLTKIPCSIQQVDFRSNPFNPKNLKAYIQLNNILSNENFNLAHCTTPIGGMLGRISTARNGVEHIIYTAHGFHFYDGAALINNIIFKYGEKLLAKITDVLITINDEDYQAAVDFKLRNNGKVYFTHGAGIDLGYKASKNKCELRKELAIPEDAILLLSAGELNVNKNNQVIIEALNRTHLKDIYYIICGEGKSAKDLERMVNTFNLSDNVRLLGFRSDILDLMQASDIFVMPSFREGLPRGLMEAMDSKMPCIVSNIRGSSDLVDDGYGGYICDPLDIECFTEKIEILATDSKMANHFGEYNKKKVTKYGFKIVKGEQKEIYKKTINKGNI